MKSKKGIDRRGFLKTTAAGAAAGAAAIALPAGVTNAQETAQAQRGTAPLPTARALAAETGPVSVDVNGLTVDNPGSDFMVDVFKSLGFEYIAANPASSFRALQESFINYGGNKSPEWLTCCHEESSVGIAAGYFRVEGKPMMIMAHGTVGLQHASMMIYDSFVARIPVYVLLGNHIDAAVRGARVQWDHSALDAASMVRDFIKWDDTPISLTHFAESAVRAYKIATAVPTAPVVLTVDAHLQESPVENRSRLRIPKLTTALPPAGDPGAVAEVAKLLVAAQDPLIVAGGAARTEKGMQLLVELAETLQVPVRADGRDGPPFPNQHPLSGGGPAGNADVIVGLEVHDLRASLNGTRPGTKRISISANEFITKSNYQEFQRYAEVDIAISGDVEATLPSLIEACKRLITPARAAIMQERGKTMAAAHARAVERERTEATYGWNASPITTARMSVELWNAVKGKDWALIGRGGGLLWNIDKFYRTLGGGGGAAALGSSLPTAVGAALAHRKHGRLCVGIQTDGDLMYAPGALWTAAHHRIPLLFVMHNNRAYHQEVMHLQRMANEHQRNITNAGIGTKIEDPNVDYAGLARSVGLYGEGPITNPNDLGPALRRAIERVERGETALVDVVTQPR